MKDLIKVLSKPLTLKEIMKELKIREKAKKARLKKKLKKLQDTKQIVKMNNGRYVSVGKDYVIGELHFTRGRAGAYLFQENGNEVFIKLEDTNGAVHKDIVIAKILSKEGRLPTGEVVSVLKRKSKTIEGIFYSKDFKTGIVKPEDPKYKFDVMVKVNKGEKIRNGFRVLVNITNFNLKDHKKVEGKIIEKIGHIEDPQTDLKAVMKGYGLVEGFPKPVIEESERLPKRVRMSKGRLDLRDESIFTIDGRNSKDFDDAVSLKKLKNGNYELGVHIADVSHYVKENSKLDIEAYKRGTSAYLINNVFPMLPEILSNDLCSLNEGVNRKTISLIMEINENGETLKYQIKESIIKSKKRMVYEDVNLALNGDKKMVKEYKPFLSTLKEMVKLQKILQSYRERRGAINLDSPEVKINIDKKGNVVSIEQHYRGIAERMIEEFMIRANEVIAEHFYKMDLPFIYRVHDIPDMDAMDKLSNYLQILNLPANFSEYLNPDDLKKILKYIEGSPLESTVNRLVVMSMKRAVYSEENIGHFGLASQYYTHFTSPIRRYPDLLVHRLIKLYAKIDNNPKNKELLKKKIAKIALHSSKREKAADEAEREYREIKKLRYANANVGNIFEAVVTDVMPYGIYLETVKEGISGLLPLSHLEGHYEVKKEKGYIINNQNKKKISVGETLKVRISKVKIHEKKIDFDILKD
jgi:ribonuclease R